MCDVLEDVQEEAGAVEAEPRGSFSVAKKCMKCDRAAVTTARTKDPFCKECFNAYFVHRFRATFGKVRLFTEGEKVLLALSGGISSRVLLGLAEEGLKLSPYKKLRFDPTIIIIDEGSVMGDAWDNRCRQLSQCLSIAIATGFHTVYTHIEQVFNQECVVHSTETLLKKESKRTALASNTEGLCSAYTDTVKSGEEFAQTTDSSCKAVGLEEQLYQSLSRERLEGDLEGRIQSLFESCSSTSSKENLLLTLRRRLLVEVARKLGYKKILVGDSASRLAVRLMGNVAQGRGNTLPLDIGFKDDRGGDVYIIKPLREFPANEVAMYASLNGLEAISIPNFTTLTPEGASIERLTESFIAGLQVDFPSTTSTVFRTGDKLTVVGEDSPKKCALCEAPTGLPPNTSVFAHLSLTDDGECEPHLWSQLCYGCRLTVKDLNSSLLPPFVRLNCTNTEDRETPSVQT